MKYILIMICVLFILPNARADVVVTQDDEFALGVTIQGRITKSDLAALKDKTFGKNEKVNYFILNSDGGDLDSALKMGTYIRQSYGKNKLGQYVAVPESNSCLSSCVFLLAAGAVRMVSGKVGIHRPYNGQDETTTEEGQKKNYKRIESTVKSYLHKMNINPSLYEEMINIAPSEIRILSTAELKHFGLSEDDPYLKEAQASKLAKMAGITKEEYYNREAKIKRCEKEFSSDEKALSNCVVKAMNKPH